MNEEQHIKRQLHNKCQEFVTERLQRIQKRIDDIEASLLSETKSSAGDKHETGRAMLQLEREKSGAQLAQVQALLELLTKVNIDNTTTNVGLGSLVITNQANYFIAISAGEIVVDNTTYFAVAANTPIGKLLLGKKVGDEIVFNENAIRITQVV
ncbi:3-oxoacyl-ACP synthase [Spongiivirga citrea]|uniref:3-oxoacyl-ACP synthase n=1 Tax=Spongiivirga citrea TaxID=1481457 RepID=A0A6M0CMK1_9FLAO|nr:3-oxoacyl-ACP synthase [Spongiivirga citrea]NER17244.1 3-oxoacyl-ACP synthase [Spongiivirga citrea]